MAFTVRYSHKLGIVESHIIGEINNQDLHEHEVQCIDLAKQNGTSRILNDATNATFAISLMDIYELPEFYEKLDLERNIRIAVLTSTPDDKNGLIRFYENVCVNRGWSSKAFNKRQEALDWLLK